MNCIYPFIVTIYVYGQLKIWGGWSLGHICLFVFVLFIFIIYIFFFVLSTVCTPTLALLVVVEPPDAAAGPTAIVEQEPEYEGQGT